MSRSFFSFAEIRERGDCRIVATELLHATIRDGRCAAIWRGGKNPESVSISEKEWFDHSIKQGGGVLEIAALAFAGDLQMAQEWAGRRFGCTEKTKTGPGPREPSRYDKFITDGYTEVARYHYRDLSGAVRHITVRLQHPDHPGKEFVQGVPDEKSPHGIHWGLKDRETFLYRLPEIAESSWVLVCEGEKSADRLAALGFPTTTAPMGAGKWCDAYTTALVGKSVALAPDNDAAGRAHADTVAAALHAAGIQVRVVGPLSSREKGGIDDWLDEVPAGSPPRTAQDVLQAIAQARPWAPPAAVACVDSLTATEAELAEAKQANAEPFRNFIPTKTEVLKRGKPVEEITKEPRTHEDMLRDIQRRFLGFPRRVGERGLFDHDRDSGAIIDLDKPFKLKAWISRRSKKNAEFTRGDAMVSELELHETITVSARRYESISIVPDWPRRSDVYYAHEALPPPSPGHERLERFVDFFLPASPEDRCLVKAFVCCPLWYIPGVPRPAWIIDSRDGQGSGKTKLVEVVAELYGSAPVDVNRNDLSQRVTDVKKRLVSSSGRNARLVLVDNVTGEFGSPELASLISAKHITGMAPYGHGEESRPNNLVYCITANSASLDGSDIPNRCLYIYLLAPSEEQRVGWVEKVQSYIQANRLGIIADIIDMLENHNRFQVPTSACKIRFAEFARIVLQPCCPDADAYADVLEHTSHSRADTNVEDEQARAISEQFIYQLEKLGIDNSTPVFLQTSVVNSWARMALQESHDIDPGHKPIQLVRDLAKSGMLPKADKSIHRWPTSSASTRYSGVAWNFTDATDTAMVVIRNADKQFEIKIAAEAPAP